MNSLPSWVTGSLPQARGREAYICAKVVPPETSPLSPAQQPRRIQGGDVSTFPAQLGLGTSWGKEPMGVTGCHDHVGKEAVGSK